MIPVYNNRYTVISKKPLEFSLPSNFDRYEGEIEHSVHKIDKLQIESDQLYNAHIILRTDSMKKNTLDSIIRNLNKLTFDHNEVYVTEAIHHGEYKKCIILSTFIVCDSYMLPAIGYEKRANATEYGNLLNHRARITRVSDKISDFFKTVI